MAQLKVVLEKPGIEHATPGLQGIALIHYTTVAPCLFHWLFVFTLAAPLFCFTLLQNH